MLDGVDDMKMVAYQGYHSPAQESLPEYSTASTDRQYGGQMRVVFAKVTATRLAETTIEPGVNQDLRVDKCRQERLVDAASGATTVERVVADDAKGVWVVRSVKSAVRRRWRAGGRRDTQQRTRKSLSAEARVGYLWCELVPCSCRSRQPSIRKRSALWRPISPDRPAPPPSARTRPYFAGKSTKSFHKLCGK